MHPLTLRRVFSGVGGVGVYKIWPRIRLFREFLPDRFGDFPDWSFPFIFSAYLFYYEKHQRGTVPKGGPRHNPDVSRKRCFPKTARLTFSQTSPLTSSDLSRLGLRGPRDCCTWQTGSQRMLGRRCLRRFFGFFRWKH